MIISCPNCNSSVQVSAESPPASLRCQRCGSDLTDAVREKVAGHDQTISVGDESATTRISSGEKIEKYSILRKIGEGGFGSVYLAYDTVLHRNVALKFPRFDRLTGQVAELFYQEAQSAAQVRHPHIVTVHELGTYDNRPYIVTDYIEGQSLKQWLVSNSISKSEAVELCIHVADALQEAHEKGVVHRDLKPGNILIDKRGKPHITDFGLAKLEIGEMDPTAQAGDIIGTPKYMSPEQAIGDGFQADARSDIYSLGVILYEMLTGQSPYKRGADVLAQVISGKIEPLQSLVPDLPKPLQQACMQALANDPADRQRTAKQFGDALRESLPRLERLYPKSRPAGRSIQKSLFAVSLVSLIVVAIVAVLIGPRLLDGKGIRKTTGGTGDGSDGADSLSQPIDDPAAPVTVHLVTEDPGAKVTIIPVDNPHLPFFQLEPIAYLDSTPQTVELPPGHYYVQVVYDDSMHFGGFRRVPSNIDAVGKFAYDHRTWRVDRSQPRCIQWPLLSMGYAGFGNIGVSQVRGGTFETRRADNHANENVTVTLPDFLISTTEITNRQYLEVMECLPMDSDLKLPLSPADADKPVSDVRWDEAMAFAERVGGRLPTVEEFDFVFRNRGTTSFPEGNMPATRLGWPVGPVGQVAFDQTVDDGITPPVIGLASNVLEWTLTRPRFLNPDGTPILLEDNLRAELQENVRLLRGGPLDALTMSEEDSVDFTPMKWRTKAYQYSDSHPKIGFRVVWDITPPFALKKPPVPANK